MKAARSTVASLLYIVAIALAVAAFLIEGELK